MNSSEKNLALSLFRIIERILLLIVVAMTLVGVVLEIRSLYLEQKLDLGDILLMFLYMEVIGMVAVFYSNRRSASVFPIYIAITALARLIILQGKDMAPENILFEATAILILSVAAWVLTRFNQDRQDD